MAEPSTGGLNLVSLILLLLFLIPLYFVLVWVVVSWLISITGGWRALTAHYLALSPPVGRGYVRQTGFVGKGRYRNLLNVYTAPEGLYLYVSTIFRVGHPPLLIPWHAIGPMTPIRWRNLDLIEVPVYDATRTQTITTLRLPAPILQHEDVARYTKQR